MHSPPCCATPFRKSCWLLQAVLEYGKAPFKPHSSALRVVWLWNEVGELLFSCLPACCSVREVLQVIYDKCHILASSTDAVLDAADPLPFLGVQYMQVNIYELKMISSRCSCKPVQCPGLLWLL